MSEEKEPGFFSQIKNQVITGVGVVITAAGGLVVSNMETLFSPEKEEVQQTIVQDSISNQPQEIIINISEPKEKETIIIKEIPVKQPVQKPTEKVYESW